MSEDSSEMPVLYTFTGSRGLRASWAAIEAGVALEYRMLPFPPRVKAKEYFAVNPLGTVPALVHRGYTMTESTAIAIYLATLDGPSPLVIAPGEEDYAAFLDFTHHADTTLTFPQTVFLRFRGAEDAATRAAGEAYADWFGKRLAKADQRLASREFLCAGRFTVADIAVAYALHLGELIGLDRLVPPALREWRSRICARPAFAAALEAERQAALSQGIA